MSLLFKMNEMLEERNMSLEELSSRTGIDMSRLEMFARDDLTNLRLQDVLVMCEVFECRRTDLHKIFHW